MKSMKMKINLLAACATLAAVAVLAASCVSQPQSQPQAPAGSPPKINVTVSQSDRLNDGTELKCKSSIKLDIDNTRAWQLSEPQTIQSDVGPLPAVSVGLYVYSRQLAFCETAQPRTVTTRSGELVGQMFVFYDNSGKLQRCRLDRPATLATEAGRVSAVKIVEFHANGNLSFCELAAPAEIRTPAGPVTASRLLFYENGALRRCLVQGNAEVRTPIGNLQATGDLFFSEEGDLTELTLAAPTAATIQGRPRNAAKLGFHSNNSLRFALLTDAAGLDTPLGRLECKGIALFTESGRLSEIELAAPAEIPTPAGKLRVNRVAFHEDGGLRYCRLAEDARIETPFGEQPVKSQLFFHANAKLDVFIPSAPFELSTPAGRVKTAYVKLDGDGAILECRLAEPASIAFPSGSLKAAGSLLFHPNGRLRSCSLAESSELDTPLGKVKADECAFRADGKLQYFGSKYEDAFTAVDTKYGRLNARRVWFSEAGKVSSLSLSQFPDPAPFITVGTDKLRIFALNLYDDGSLRSCTLAGQQKVTTALGELTAGGTVSFHENGRLNGLNLPQAQELGTAMGTLAARGSISFQKDGSLWHLNTAAPVPVDTPAGRVEAVALGWHANKTLRYCTLAESAEISSGVGALKAKRNLFFTDGGKLDSCDLDAPTAVATAFGRAEATGLIFSPEGRLLRVNTREPLAVKTSNGVVKTRYLRLYPNGKLFVVKPIEPMTTAGKSYAVNDSLGWSEAGKFLGKMTWNEEQRTFLPEKSK